MELELAISYVYWDIRGPTPWWYTYVQELSGAGNHQNRKRTKLPTMQIYSGSRPVLKSMQNTPLYQLGIKLVQSSGIGIPGWPIEHLFQSHLFPTSAASGRGKLVHPMLHSDVFRCTWNVPGNLQAEIRPFTSSHWLSRGVLPTHVNRPPTLWNTTWVCTRENHEKHFFNAWFLV